MRFKQKRSVESILIGGVFKYGAKVITKNYPELKIIISLVLVRLGIKKSVYFASPYLNTASTWATRLGLGRRYQYQYSFAGGFHAHRAIGVPQPDNSHVGTVMTFKAK